MRNLKLQGFNKFLILFLIVTIVIFVIGFAVSGWQGETEPPLKNETAQNGGNNNGNLENNNADNSNDGQESTDVPPKEPVITISNNLTGLEISEIESKTIPIGFVIDPLYTIYGLSEADISIEIPIENGKTRILSYTTDETTLWKIGALAPTRNFITSLSRFFGGYVVGYGNDDKINYSGYANEYELDLSKHSDCYSIENTTFVYTGENSINNAFYRTHLITTAKTYKNAPYIFSNSAFQGIADANTVTIPYSQSNSTLVYNPQSCKYEYYKNNEIRNDMLTGKTLAYTNVFILFSDTTTYENSSGCELVVDTYKGGKGYYISGGKFEEFKWSTDINDNLIFKSLDGEILDVCRGNAYFAYYKSSLSSDVVIK